jgi:hypothetical protein
MEKHMIQVYRMQADHFDRPRVRVVETREIFADVSLGDGYWHTVTGDGEPLAPIRSDTEFEYVKFSPRACCELATPMYCVCMFSCECPEHGEKHLGTHA